MKDLIFTSLLLSPIMLLLLLYRGLSRSYSSRSYYWIWLLLSLRLLIFFDLGFETSYDIGPRAYNYDLGEETGNDRELEADAYSFQEGENYRENPGWGLLSRLKGWSFWIWLLGFSLILSYNFSAYLIYKRRLKPSLIEFKYQGLERLGYELNLSRLPDLYTSSLVDSPLLMGIFRPRIILPIAAKNLDHIIGHELVHLKRGDLVYKLLLFLAASLHWFNPIIGPWKKAVHEDLEISCDGLLLERKDRNYQKAYARSLLDSMELAGKPRPYTSQYLSSKKLMKKRIKKILSDGKRGLRPIFLSLGIVIISLSMLISCRQEEESIYGLRIKYVGDNSAVGKIINSLDFNQDYEFEKMEILSGAEGNGLSLSFKGEGSYFEDFKFDAMMIFSLIENLDYLQIRSQDREETYSRAYIDSISTSIVAETSKNLYRSSRNFKKLEAVYKDFKEREDYRRVEYEIYEMIDENLASQHKILQVNFLNEDLDFKKSDFKFTLNIVYEDYDKDLDREDSARPERNIEILAKVREGQIYLYTRQGAKGQWEKFLIEDVDLK